MHIGTRSAPVHPGQIVLIPRGRSQYIRNTGTGDLVFLCIVTPKWQAADEELGYAGYRPYYPREDRRDIHIP